MSWFDEQINTRKKSDEDILESAYFEMAKAVLGDGIGVSFSDSAITKNAVEEILKYYRIKINKTPKNLTVVEDQLEFHMHPHGFMRRRVELIDSWYKDSYGPLLATLKDGTPVALIPSSRGYYTYLDPKEGRRVVIDKKRASNISKDAFAFYRPFANSSMGVRDLIKYILSLVTKQDIVFILISYLLITMLGLLTPRFTNILVGTVITSHSARLLFAISVFMLCTSVASAFISVFRDLVNERLNSRISFCAESATMMRILSLPADFFKDYSAGELSNISGYVSLLCNSLANTFVTTTLQVVFSLAYISSIVRYASSLILPSVIFLLITMAFSLITSIMQMGLMEKQMKAHSEVAGLSYSLISGVEKIKLSGAEKRAFAKWGKAFAAEAAYTYNPPILIKINTVISLIITSVQTVVMYYITIKQGVSLAEYSAFNAAFGTMSGAFTGLLSMALFTANIKPVLEMVEPILKARPEIEAEKEVISRVSGAIKIENVSFKYHDEGPNVLSDFSLSIKPGQYVAIVGKTGCGKSTLVRLLLGFEKPDKGAIYYDNKDIKRIDLKSLRKNIGVVLQDGKVFSGDIFSNITISDPQLTLADAWLAAEVSGLADDIKNMPMGMNTMISEGTGGISGGQKQRLMIARAVAPKPKILIFDEATSALDNLTQKKVSDALDSMGCTRIVIAHRLSTIRNCDRIVVIDGGRIIEDGTYEELIETNGFFKDLVDRQRV